MKNTDRVLGASRMAGLLALVAIVLAMLSFCLPVHPASAQGAWYGEYFNNRHLAGGPVLTRYEDGLNFDWGHGSPGTGVPADNFSARWTREEWFESGTYRFSYRSDDGIRVWVGDTLVVDDWRDRQAAWTIVDRFISRGTHRVRVEYYEGQGSAAAQVSWERVSGGAGWRAEYFGNRDLSGSPVLVRYDAAIDFDWGYGSPDPAVPSDNFSVRWTRSVDLNAGTYRFNSSTDDGVRIFVDGHLVVSNWANAELPNTRSGDISLGSGPHNVVVEYYEQGGEASAHVWWNRLGTFSGWEGRYYDNVALRGGPALIRDDAQINFDWGEGAPSAGMPADNFSVSWTRQVNFSPGYYRFNVRSDDGMRFWLDNGLVMDYWRPQDYQWHYAGGFYLSGLHTLKVEYFEQGGSARINFWWESESSVPSPTLPGRPAPTPTPTSTPAAVPGPSPTPDPGMRGPWQGEYFDNRDLNGTPVLVRSDAAVDFNWNWDAPAPALDKDNFSVRWSGSFYFEAGRYTFRTYSDDGVRLYVDDRRVINSWRGMRGYRSATVNLSEGTHTVRLEYFERTGIARARLWWENRGTSSTPASATPVSGPTTAPNAGGPLQLDAWPVSTRCTGGGWVATIFVEGHGGDGRYTYAWERQVRGGPTAGSMTFEVQSSGWDTAIVGKAWVTSAGESVFVGLHIPHPVCQ